MLRSSLIDGGDLVVDQRALDRRVGISMSMEGGAECCQAPLKAEVVAPCYRLVPGALCSQLSGPLTSIHTASSIYMRDDSLPLMIGVTSDAIPNLIWGPVASFNAGGTPLFPLNAAVLFRPLAGSSRRVADVRLVKTERDAELLIAGLNACAPVAVDAVVAIRDVWRAFLDN